ncbi:PIR protein [Plasmodium yoelii yoelii]|uniref:PIR protein n=1 Tax=Plasmodium yoelii yoelii TaxID=73239 RepID=A0AAE9WIQ0_PLAYO|nr:PIR protein [Plasmodium yoelii yoelii]
MSQFYELFYQICNKIHEYNTNGGTINDIGNITTKCSQAYTKIYNKVDKYECKQVYSKSAKSNTDDASNLLQKHGPKYSTDSSDIENGNTHPGTDIKMNKKTSTGV